ncbi:hypothetical protein HK098_001145 [Nowakowskiella sp. JEL0407]|nr:hypothetical protein HK098_001145 [Nowakowskiella sp. JEL0407]
MSDWEDDLDDLAYDRAIADRDWYRLQDTHGVIGYKEGVAEGKEKLLQEGFDLGYSEGAKIGMEIGKLRGIANILLTLMNDETFNIDSKQEYTEELLKMDESLRNYTVNDFTNESNSSTANSETIKTIKFRLDELLIIFTSKNS